MTQGSERAIGLVASLIEANSDLNLAVAVDGGDAAGKTTFADALGTFIANRTVIRVQADHFENPRPVRYRRGSASPEGYFEDTYDFAAIESVLLKPFQLGAPIIRGLIDWYTDEPLNQDAEQVTPGSVLIVDGCFLLVDQLRQYFDIAVFLDVPADERLQRAIPRQEARFSSIDDLVERFRTRYLPGYELYLERCRPMDSADVVIDNSDFDNPVITKRP